MSSAKSPGNSDNRIVEVATAMARMSAHKSERVAEFAVELHEAVRTRAGLPSAWAEISQGLRDHYIRLAIKLDGRRAVFFGTC